MKRKIVIVSLLFSFVALIFSTKAETSQSSAGIGPSFKGPVGLQLYSLRDQFKKDVPATLDQVRAFGITNVELAGTYGVAPEKFKEQLDARGLKAVSAILGMNSAATISKTSHARRSCLASSMPVARGFRTKILLTKRLRARRRRFSIALVKHSRNMASSFSITRTVTSFCHIVMARCSTY